MKIAILSDIHGNLSALDAVLAHLDAHGGADQIVVLGDIAAMGPQPREVMDRLRERGCAIVQGNTDAWSAPAATPPKPPKKIEEKREKRISRLWHWLKDELRPEDVEFLNALPLTHEEMAGAERLWFVHGSPRRNNENIWPTTSDGELREMLQPARAAGATIVCCGHTHHAMLRVFEGITIVNPGVVGTQGDGDVRAAYVLFTADDAGPRIEFRRVAYDPASTIAAAEARDFPMPKRYARRLHEGTELL